METSQDGVQSEPPSEEAWHEETFHSYDDCKKVVLNLDFDYDMVKYNEELDFCESTNIHLEATLDDLLGGLEAWLCIRHNYNEYFSEDS
jgi:hypothetical protein